jgi:RNA polymerase sigma-70 factor (ECF subfamily)
MDRAEEEPLVRRLLRCDEDAWRRFCAEFWPVLAGNVQLRFRCDARKAEEIVQSTFVRCIRSIRTFDASRGRLLDWLNAVAANEARTCLQGESLAPLGEFGSDGGQWPLAEIANCLDRQPLPDELLARRDTQTIVAACLLELPPRQRQVLVMKYQEESKVVEIAGRLGLSEKAVESLLSRGRESFRRALAAKAAAVKLTIAEIQE